MIKVSSPSFSQLEARAAAAVVESQYVSMGEEVKNFEKDLKDYLKVENEIVCVNTGTSALHIALQVLGIGLGDEVLVPTITYVASFQAVRATGAVPVPCDCSRETCLIDLEDAAKRVSPKTKAILNVHYASEISNIKEVYEFAQVYGLLVVEDAAHSFGCFKIGEGVSRFADATCFSFDPIKNISSIEGGAILFRNGRHVKLAQDARLLGVIGDSEKRYSKGRSLNFDVEQTGWRYHMGQLNAKVGRIQLGRFEAEFAPRRIEIAKRYKEELKCYDKIAFFTPSLYSSQYRIVPHIFPLRVPMELKAKIEENFRNESIQFTYHYLPNHLLKAFRSEYELPVAEKLFSELISIPLHACLSDRDQSKVIETIKKSINRS